MTPSVSSGAAPSPSGRTAAPRRVVVVGAGLTGLATAWHLRDDAEVTLLEASDRAGGEIATIDFAGAPLDVGADAFLARQPEAERLARAAGFGNDDLVAPASRQVQLWVRGRLRPLPGATVLGVPGELVALARSRVLPPVALARAAAEPLLPRRHVVGDRSVGDLVGERFGRSVVDLLVEPLLAGVYAGRADRLSVAATAPAVWDASRRHRSLLAGLARQRAAADAAGPVFLTVRGGLGRLVDRLADGLGTRLRTGVSVLALDRDRVGWTVETTDGMLRADQIVLAVPAPAAAELLAPVVPDAARELLAIRYASVAVVALAYDPSAARAVPAGSGMLVPRSEGRLVKAATWTSRKWPHHAGRDAFVLRASVGRVGEPAPLDLDDVTLATRVDAEIRWATGITAPASEHLVVRWPDALPQYDVGHLQRVDRIRAALAAAPPGLHVGGAALDGVGLAARARDAERLAHAVLTSSRTG